MAARLEIPFVLLPHCGPFPSGEGISEIPMKSISRII